jgi:hypothetical protein
MRDGQCRHNSGGETVAHVAESPCTHNVVEASDKSIQRNKDNKPPCCDKTKQRNTLWLIAPKIKLHSSAELPFFI